MQHFELTDLIQLEALNMLCGERLGEGSSRKVFRSALDHKLVIKIATNENGIKQNWEEFNTWESVQFVDKINSYFARVHSISEYGSILIQEYVPSIPKGKYKIPSFFTDLKPENYGLVIGSKSNQFVCRDYGVNLLRERGMRLNLVNYEVV